MDNTAKELLMLSLGKFYRKDGVVDKLLAITQGQSNMSLRLLDWFVTNYSKKHSTHIIKDDGTHLNVYLSYRTQLKAYSKQQFDPFRRRDRISFYYAPETYIETTIGQLNFFKWVIENNINTYIIENVEAIEKDMISSQKLTRKQETAKSKRSQLSSSFTKSMNTMHGTHMVAFA